MPHTRLLFNNLRDVLSHRAQGALVSTIHLRQNTTATPEQLIAGLTDFGPGRSELFGYSADEYLKVHSESPGHADVTEGSRGVWERLDYDWTDPNRVVMRTIDSNLWGDHSTQTYAFSRQPDDSTDVDVVIVREGKNFKGKVLALLHGSLGRGTLEKELGKTTKAIEARHYGS